MQQIIRSKINAYNRSEPRCRLYAASGLVLGMLLLGWSAESRGEGVVVPIPTPETSTTPKITVEKSLTSVSEKLLERLLPRDLPNNRRVQSNARAVIINGLRYPDTGVFIPNSFVSAKENRIHTLLHYVNRVRNRPNTYGCQPDCSDGEISFEVDLYNSEKHSLTLLPLIQSLSPRNGGTTVGQGFYLGFRFSTQLSDTLAFSIGGETLKRFDNTADLGRNAFVGFSKAFSWGSSDKPNVIANLGLGSGIYSTYGNILFRNGFRSDRSSLVNDPNNFDFGLVGSLTYLHSSRLAMGLEYSGYGVGFGPSFRPFARLPLTATLYFYDLLWVPSKIRWREEVTPNFFINMSYSF